MVDTGRNSLPKMWHGKIGRTKPGQIFIYLFGRDCQLVPPFFQKFRLLPPFSDYFAFCIVLCSLPIFPNILPTILPNICVSCRSRLPDFSISNFFNLQSSPPPCKRVGCSHGLVGAWKPKGHLSERVLTCGFLEGFRKRHHTTHCPTGWDSCALLLSSTCAVSVPSPSGLPTTSVPQSPSALSRQSTPHHVPSSWLG